MTNTDTRRNRLRRTIATAGLALAVGAATLAAAGPASAAPAGGTWNVPWTAPTAPAAPAPAAAVRPPGPVRDLRLDFANGSVREVSFTASWQPAAPNGGTDLRYVVDLRDDLGGVTTQTTTDTSIYLHEDYCRAPLTATVRARTTDPGSGRTLTGPPVSGRIGTRDLCTINMSIKAVPGRDRGTIDVTLHHEQPIDPYVSGPCALFFDGVQRWSGVCGGAMADRTVTVSGLTPGRPYDIVLRTTTPRNTVLSSNHVRTAAT